MTKKGRMTLPAGAASNTNSFSLSPRTPATLSMSTMSYTHEEEELSAAVERVRRLCDFDEAYKIIPKRLRKRYQCAAKRFLERGSVDRNLPAFVFQFLKSHKEGGWGRLWNQNELQKLYIYVGRHPSILSLRAKKKENENKRKKKKKKKKKITQGVVVAAAVAAVAAATPIDLTGGSDSEDEHDVVINNKNVSTIAFQTRLSPGDEVQIINEFALLAGPRDRPHAIVHAVNSPGERQTYDIILTCSVEPEDNELWARDGQIRRNIKPLYLKRFPLN